MQEAVDWIQAQGPWGPLFFVLFYALATVAFVPGSFLTLSAGALFGVVEGVILVSFAATLSAAISFLLARFTLRDRIERMLRQRPKFQAIDQAIGRDGVKIVLLLRLSPVFPFTLLNYAIGLTSIRFWPAILTSWVGMLPGTMLYIYIGSAVRVATGETSVEQKIFYGVGVLATLGATVLITRIANRALAGKLEEPQDEAR